MKQEHKKELRSLLILWFLFMSIGIWIATMPGYSKAQLFHWVDSLAR